MPRPQKKEINLTKESMLSLMQEIYNELVEQRNTASRIQLLMIVLRKNYPFQNYKHKSGKKLKINKKILLLLI